MEELPAFHCIQCGECCRHISMIPELSSFVGSDGVCIHLKNNLCDIYESRPDVCNYYKAYKKYFSNLTPEEYHKLIVESCNQLLEINKKRLTND